MKGCFGNGRKRWVLLGTALLLFALAGVVTRQSQTQEKGPKKVLFVSNRLDPSAPWFWLQIYVMNTDGTNVQELTKEGRSSLIGRGANARCLAGVVLLTQGP